MRVTGLKPLLSETVAAKVSPEEKAALAQIRTRFGSLMTESSLAASMLLLGALTYWRTLGKAQNLDREGLLAAINLEVTKRKARKKGDATASLAQPA